jgi:hypothetical protein
VAAAVLIAPPLSLLDCLGDSPDPLPWAAVIGLLFFQLVALCYVALLLWIARDLGSDPFPPGVRWRRTSAFLALPVGAVLVLLSPFLTIVSRGLFFPSPEHMGWEILARRADWTLAMSFAGQCNQSLWTWPWLSTAESMLGYVFYLAAIVASIALLIWLAKIRLSPRRAQGALALPVFAAAFSFALFWFSTEAFWAVQEYAGAASWVTILAIVLWVTSPACLLTLLVHAARGRRSVERWRMLMYLQTPAVAYLFAGYLPQEVLDFAPGLLALVAGLQLESLACVGLLAISPVDPPKPEPGAAAHVTV